MKLTHFFGFALGAVLGLIATQKNWMPFFECNPAITTSCATHKLQK